MFNLKKSQLVLKKLDNSQLKTFDQEYVNEQRWELVKKQIDKDFPHGDFSFLDIGGGNGKFADKILHYYPKSVGTVMDNSQLLLNKNELNNTKKLIYDSVENLNKYKEKYDLVSLNWLLHHLVGTSYNETRKNIIRTLNNVKHLLTDSGRVCIWENIYNGIIFDALPSHIIFSLTSSQLLTPFTKKMGANTAGIGVCFLSNKQWMFDLEQLNFKLLEYTEIDKQPNSLLWKIFLHTGNISKGLFWLSL